MALVRIPFRAMASDNEVQIDADAIRARRAADAAIADVRRIEAKYSRYQDDSLTTRINRSAGGPPVDIDAETAGLIAYADRCFTQSGGRFDITSGVLRRAWDFRRQPPTLPTDAVLAAALARIGWADVEWDERAIRLPRAGMEIDFGGIGKEYAADRMATILIDHGIAHGLVNLGGDVRAVGTQSTGAPWRVGIRHPREVGRTIAAVDLADGAVATSGDYERFFEIDGRRYTHILDPRSGMPVSYWQSVSVVAPLCIVAGSCSTIAMLMEAAGEDFLAQQGLDYIAVGPDGAPRRRSGAAGSSNAGP
jgi:FAD:protein FMN transferase